MVREWPKTNGSQLSTRASPRASREWYPTGQLKEQSNYVDGDVHGKYEGWHENGYKKFEANYSDGQLDGSVHRWNNNGRTISKQSFKEGQLIRER